MSVVSDFYKQIEEVVGELSKDKKDKVEHILFKLYNKANSEGYQEGYDDCDYDENGIFGRVF